MQPDIQPTQTPVQPPPTQQEPVTQPVDAQSPPPSQPTYPKSSKKLYLALAIAVFVIALLAGLILFLLINKDDSSNQTASTSQTTNSEADDTTVAEKPKVIATLASSQPGIDVELFQPKKVGKTLVVNYNLVNSTGDRIFSNAYKAGIYTTQFGVSSTNQNGGGPGGTAEPYAISDSDGQKYGLARDDQNQPLASNKVDEILDPGEKTSGYVTLTLPPSGTAVSIYLGDMNAFNDVNISY